jgi:hypothetical protein
MTPCPMGDAISECTKGNEGDSSYYIRKRDPCKVERITESEMSHGYQVDRVPTQIQRNYPVRGERCKR